MNTKNKIISAIITLNLLYFLMKEKKRIFSDKVKPEEKKQKGNSLFYELFYKKYKTSNKQKINLLELNSTNSKLFITSSDNTKKIIQIKDKKEVLIYDFNYNLIFNEKKTGYIITGAVSSEDKKYLLVIFKSTAVNGEYILKYINYKNIFEDIKIHTDSQISAITLSPGIILYSLINSKNCIYIIQKTNEDKWENKEYNFNLEHTPLNIITTSLKFFNQKYFIQTLKIIYPNRITNMILLHQLNYNYKILYEFSEENYKKSFIQPIYSNSNSNQNELIFEFSKGKLFYLNSKLELFLLSKSNQKINKISNNNNHIIIQKEDEFKNILFTYIHKTNETYSVEKTFILPKESKIISFFVENDSLYLINENGNIKTFLIKRWYDQWIISNTLNYILYFIALMCTISIVYAEKMNVFLENNMNQKSKQKRLA